jgi:hypothetical protein
MSQNPFIFLCLVKGFRKGVATHCDLLLPQGLWSEVERPPAYQLAFIDFPYVLLDEAGPRPSGTRAARSQAAARRVLVQRRGKDLRVEELTMGGFDMNQHQAQLVPNVVATERRKNLDKSLITSVIGT